MAADLIFHNAKVITMDQLAPRAQAIAIHGNRIEAVGSDAEIMALSGPGTRVIDAHGKTLLPGFNEAHMHLFTGADELSQLQLSGTKGMEALTKAVRGFAAANPDKALIMAQGADYTILGNRRVTRHDLDAIIPDRPFLMYAPDHHTGWANTIALEKAGLLKGRKLGAGNEIVMAADGLAEGELREGEALQPVAALAGSSRARLGLDTGGEPDPEPTPEEWDADLATMQKGLDYCAAHGITSIQNMDGNFYTLELLAEIERRRGLAARVTVPFHYKNFMALPDLEKASDMHRRFTGDKLKSGFVKFFMDGVIDSSTAVMIEDYADQPGWKGDPLFSAESFNAAAIEADKRGLQMAVHAIGDGAVRAVLNGYEAAAKANGKRDARHRVEHIEVIHPDDIPRFGKLGVIASMQPPHPPGQMGLPLEPTLTRIGEHRWQYSYAWQTLRDAGAVLVFASDWPVSPIAPLACISAAMTRQKWREDLPEQRQSLENAIAGYTRDGAYAEFMDGKKGVLKAGLLADCVLVSGDMEAATPEAIAAMTPLVTMCDGKITFKAA
ncbi:MAG: amidohydrolase [Aestuariivirgaceae bacterium]|nr:amidohydrolase [Aestuariivirgaceae bacterium]